MFTGNATQVKDTISDLSVFFEFQPFPIQNALLLRLVEHILIFESDFSVSSSMTEIEPIVIKPIWKGDLTDSTEIRDEGSSVVLLSLGKPVRLFRERRRDDKVSIFSENCRERVRRHC